MPTQEVLQAAKDVMDANPSLETVYVAPSNLSVFTTQAKAKVAESAALEKSTYAAITALQAAAKNPTVVAVIEDDFDVVPEFTNDTVGDTVEEDVTVHFTNASTGLGPFTYEWNFGDGQTSALENPSHVFANAGGYDVMLNVTGATGDNSITHAITVTPKP